MNRRINLLRNICWRHAVTVFLTAITFLVIPAFSNSASFQAQARTQIASKTDYDPVGVSPAAIKKATDMAEDRVGDRDIGDTGLKNIKKLGENIPETAKLIVKQRFDNDRPADIGDPDVVKDAVKNRD